MKGKKKKVAKKEDMPMKPMKKHMMKGMPKKKMK